MLCKPNHGQCTKNKDIHPLAGVVTVDIRVADPGYGEWKTPEEIISRSKRLGLPIPSVNEVILKGTSPTRRTCWVTRALEYGDLWEETYGLIVDGHRFVIQVFYNDERPNVDSFRSVVADILSSISIVAK